MSQEPTVSRYTLLSLRPKFVFEQPISSTPQGCTKGHRWNYGMTLYGVELDLSTLGLTDGKEMYCFLCLVDLLRTHCGRVLTLTEDE